MTNKPITGLAILCATLFAGGCNSDYEPGESIASSVVVNSFSLSEDDDVLENLDSVFFSIDLAKGTIFNADSLPYGTKISKLVPQINTLEGASLAELTVKRPGLGDTVYNYLTNPNDSIDFSNGPVSLKLKSPDGLVEKTYSITVNVHKLKTDSLSWSQIDRTTLPTTLASVKMQKSAQMGEKIFCLTSDGSKYCLASGSPESGIWQKEEVTFGFTPDVASFNASCEALYILDRNGRLYTGNGSSWSATNVTLTNIYGAYGSDIVGCNENAASPVIVRYPSNTVSPMPDGFPVRGTSQPVHFTFPLSGEEQMVMVGGKDIDGHTLDAVWAFDGNSWMKINTLTTGMRLTGITLVPYFTFRESYAWTTTKYTTLFAFGGKDIDGKNSKEVFISTDFGMSWTKAGQLMQLPDYIPAMCDAQGFVISTEYTSRSAQQQWVSFPGPRRPVGARIDNSWLSTLPSRATKPVESWECPYIYIFGGLDENGQLCNTIWRGAINRLTFKPII